MLAGSYAARLAPREEPALTMRKASMGDKVRRVVTAHDVMGHAVVQADEKVAVPGFPGENVGSAVIWATGTVPADNSVDVEIDLQDDGRSLTGAASVLRIVEFGPGYASPRHRTLSIDYLFVLSGELELELDEGTLVRLYQGDIVVQRGTSHQWRNPSQDTPCRVLVSMIEARMVSIGGAVLQPAP
jgi:quercetin dioxygenase-like cupin family protein